MGTSRYPRLGHRIAPLTLVAQQAQQLDKHICVSSQATLENELMDLAVAAKDKRRAQIATRYFGWDGLGGCTLQAVGDQLGITRERVRQICDRVAKALRERNPSTPMLDRALMFVAKHVLRPAEEIESKLMSDGLTRIPFRLEGLSSAAEILGRKTTFTITILGQKRFAVPPGTSDLVNTIAQTTRKLVGRQGVATVVDVAAQVEEEVSCPVSKDFVTQVVKEQEGFQWLNEAGSWFWLSSVARNRLLNQIEKILSVAERIEVSELRTGVTRHYRMNGFAPPRRVLLELCRRAHICRVEDNTIIADPPLNWEEILADTEKTMVRVLKEHGTVIQQAKFEELCLNMGINRGTFYVYLSYSPVIARYARSVYGLPGADIPPGMAESLVPKQYRPGRVLKDYGWAPDGKIWLGFRLSKSMIASGTFTVPTAMKRFIVGQFILKDDEGPRIGTLVSKENGAWGLGPFFKRRGGDPGDHLLILFDLTAREAIVRIGDNSLLDDFQVSGQ